MGMLPPVVSVPVRHLCSPARTNYRKV